MKLKEKFNNSIQLISTIAATMTGYPEYIDTTIDALIDGKYLDAADKILYTRYGERELRSTDDIVIAMKIVSYLVEHARLYEKCLEYIAAEYNPIENFNGTESETNQNVYGTLNEHGTDTKAQDTYQHGSHTDTFTTGSHDDTYHIAKVQTQNTPGTDTVTTQTAPYESETFYNKDKSTTSHTAGTETVERIASGDDGGNDKTTYSQRIDTNAYVQYSDIDHVGGTVDAYSHITDSRTDTLTRTLNKHGNLGVATSAQMIAGDYETWQKFGWLSDMAHDIANLLSEGVWAL